MTPISIIMPTYNARDHIKEAIESVLNQTFTEYEFIIIDDGSTDNTVSIINSYKDARIKLILNEHNFINTLNTGLQAAAGKYIARMDADDIMHIDRLKIQYAIMEEDPRITVCSSWMTFFGNDIPKGMVSRPATGFVEYPLLQMLQHCIFFHPTIMLRSEFFKQNRLKYEKEYIYAEDYKLWFEVAKCGGIFYVETQSLLYYRVTKTQVSEKKQKEQDEVSIRIKNEILAYLIALNKENYPYLSKLEEAMRKIQKGKLINNEEIFKSFFRLFLNNKNSLNVGTNNLIINT
jgi:putative sugar transferase